MLFFFFFTKSEEMSRVGSRDRHPRWRSKKPGNDSCNNDWDDHPDKEKKLYLFKDRKKMRMKKSCFFFKKMQNEKRGCESFHPQK